MPFGVVLHGRIGHFSHAIKSERLRFIPRRAFRFTPRVRVGREEWCCWGTYSTLPLRGTLVFSAPARRRPSNRAEPFPDDFHIP